MMKKTVSISFFMLLIIAGMGLIVFSAGSGRGQASFDDTDFPCSDCHGGGDNNAIVTVTGIPSSYAPSTAYPLTVTMTAPAPGGENNFVIVVDVGTFTSSDANVLVYAANKAKATNDQTVTTWSLSWTSPAAGPVNFEIWGVSGDAAGGSNEPTDQDLFSSALIPEFSSILLPIVSVMALVLIVSIYRKKRE